MKKKIVFLIVILAVASGGFFYWLWTWQPEIEPDFSIGEPSEAPTLFGKEDYKIEEREDGKFIVVEKVGLTCKVPEEWKIEYKKTADIEPQYWLDLFSPDLTTTTSNILTNGCKISITAGVEEENNKEIKARIKLLKESPGIKPEEISYIYKDYIFKVIEISTHQTLEWIAPEKPLIGQVFGIDIPIGDRELIDVTLAFPPGNREECSPVWEEFLGTVVIE